MSHYEDRLTTRLIARLETLKIEETQLNAQLVSSTLYQRLAALQVTIAELEALVAPKEDPNAETSNDSGAASGAAADERAG